MMTSCVPVVAGQAVLLRVVMEGGRDVLGGEESSGLFERAERRQDGLAPIAALQAELNETYGALRGPGVAIRLGRAALKYGLREWGEQAGLATPGFRLQPAPRRARIALGKLAGLMGGQLGARVELNEDARYWYWQVDESPACHLLTGVLLELMSWAGGGRFFAVTEVACRAAGASACVFRLDKAPLD